MLYISKAEFRGSKAAHKKELHGLAYRSLFKALGAEYKIDVEQAEYIYNEHGKPYFRSFPNIYFSISHCQGLAVTAVSDFENGVDVEVIRDYPERVVSRSFSKREKELLESCEDKNMMFFRMWTLKESFVKALGIGISYPLKTAEFLIFKDEINAFGCDGYSFIQYIFSDGYVCSLCTKDAEENKVYYIGSSADKLILPV